jgi:chemotaxis protein methyltransferase CheR
MTDEQIHQFFNHVFELYCYDFREYSIASIKRRIEATLIKLKISTLQELDQLIQNDSQVFSQVLKNLVVPTTEMFRDPDLFKVFRQEIVPHLKTYPSIKLWVAGCSTGEEVYSYAIVLKEEGLLERTQIYATDINPASLEKAQSRKVSLEKMKQYSKNYLLAGGTESLSEYYKVHDKHVIFHENLTKNVVFSDHCLVTDKVFAEVEYVSCRNVMIYFEKSLQEKVLGLFEESLRRRGFLALGDKENLRFSCFSTKFSRIGPGISLYRKIG